MKKAQSDGNIGKKLLRNKEVSPKAQNANAGDGNNARSSSPQGNTALYATSLPRNVNYYGHFLKQPQITEKDIEWVLKLRTADQTLRQKLNKIPNAPFGVYDKRTAVAENKHDPSDLSTKQNIGRIEHLVRKRLGPTPSVGQVDFETGLRTYNQRDKKLSDLERGWSTIPKRDRHEFPELPLKVNDEIKMRKTIKETGKQMKLTQTAFDGYQNYPNYNDRLKKIKNFQQARHMLNPETFMSSLHWSLGLRD